MPNSSSSLDKNKEDNRYELRQPLRRFAPRRELDRARHYVEEGLMAMELDRRECHLNLVGPVTNLS